MSTPDDTSKKKGEKNWPVLVLCVGFCIVVVAASIGYIAGSSALNTATKQLDRRSITVRYLGDDNEWDNCNDDKNREFFAAVSEVIEASTAGDDAKLERASKRLTKIRTELENIGDIEVCGPPPKVPTDPDDKKGN